MEPLNKFFDAIQSDGRITMTHIAVYSSILQYWSTHSQTASFRSFSREIMEIAKISAHSTYHRCLKDLNDWQYIVYRPSFNRLEGSEIKLVMVDQD